MGVAVQALLACGRRRRTGLSPATAARILITASGHLYCPFAFAVDASSPASGFAMPRSGQLPRLAQALAAAMLMAATLLAETCLSLACGCAAASCRDRTAPLRQAAYRKHKHEYELS